MKLWKVILICIPIAGAVVGLIAGIGFAMNKSNKKKNTKENVTTVGPVTSTYNVSVTNNSSFTVTGTGSYEEGTNVTLTATNYVPGYFLTWSINGEVKEVGSSYSLTVGNSNIDITLNSVSYNYLYFRTESNIYFGTYPQKEVEDDRILDELDEAYPFDAETWTDYNYYISGEVDSYMFYKDVDTNNDGLNDFRGVYFTKYRPVETNREPGNDPWGWGYLPNIVYWFSYEPVKWNILTEGGNKALLFASLNLDSQEFYASNAEDEFEHNGGTGYANNYELSNIRKWLNDNFYNTAFNELQKELIIKSTVDNSINQVYKGDEEYYQRNFSNYDVIEDYICNNTQDNVFLLSFRELYDYYDEEHACDTVEIPRAKLTTSSTDYAGIQGIQRNQQGRSLVWLRTPGNVSNSVDFIGENGGLVNSGYNAPFRRPAHSTAAGVRPALWITLKDTYKKVTIINNDDSAGTINISGEIDAPVGYCLNLIAVPNEGYEFDGWYINDSSEAISKTINFKIDITDNIKIEAKWIAKKYTLNVINKSDYNFEYNHGGTYDYKENVTLHFNVPAGYCAELYNEKGELLNLENNTYSFTMSYKDLEYSVYFKLIEYRIVYDIPYGIANPNPIKHTVETDEIVLQNPETHAEYTFNGWFIDDVSAQKIPGHVTGTIYVHGDYTTNKYNVNIVNNTNNHEITGAGEYDYNSLVKIAIQDNDGTKAMAIELETLDKDNNTVIRMFNRDVYEFYMPNHNVTLTIMDIDNPNYYNGESPETDRNFDGDEVLYFGSYPQALVKDRTVLQSLIEFAGNAPTEAGAEGWNDYGFYEQDKVKSYTWYKDITLNGDKYRAVYFTEYRPGHLDWKYSQAEADPDRVFEKGEIYFFKFEPIAWKKSKIDGNNVYAALLCLDATHYGDGNVGYNESNIRNFLVNTFYKTAFTEAQKDMLEDIYTSGNDIKDKVCIYDNYQPVKDDFSETLYLKCEVTDYALCLRPKSVGVSYATEGRGTYYLRIGYEDPYHAEVIHDVANGKLEGGVNKKTVLCIRPVIKINATNKYNVFLDVNDTSYGSATGSGSYNVNDLVTLTSTPSEGYVFAGWVDNISGNTLSNESTYEFTITKNCSITAKFLKKYYITYLLNSDHDEYDTSAATNEDGNVAYYTAEQKVTFLNASCDGYDFLKWHDEETGEDIYSTPNSDYRDITIYAEWTLKEYTIKYENCDSNGENPTTYHITDATIVLNAGTKKGHSFVGWKDENDVIITEIPTGSYGDITLTGEFTPDSFNLTINNNTDGLTLSIGSGSYDYDTELTLEIVDSDGTYNLFIEIDGKEAVMDKYTFKMPNNSLTIDVMKIKTGKYTKDYEVIYFGEYPQTEVKDETTKQALINLAGKNPTETGADGWIDYGFYEQNQVKSYMWYKDITLNGDKYRAVYFTNYRPAYTNQEFGEMTSDYAVETMHFFKFEPIKWIEFEFNDEKYLTTYSVIDEIQYSCDGSRYEYQYSDIRTFVNSDFYNLAFTTELKDIMLPAYVTSGYSYDYNDMVTIFGWFTDVTALDESYRQINPTDYARCLRPLNGESLVYGGGGAYAFRTMNNSSGNKEHAMRDPSLPVNWNNPYISYMDQNCVIGVRPIIKVNLDAFYKVEPEKNINDAGTVTGRGGYWNGSEATLTAEANTGYRFIGWSTDDGATFESDENSIVVPITGNCSIKAIFAEVYSIEYDLVLENVTNHPDNREWYTIYDPINFGALSKVGYEFDGWFIGDTENQITDTTNRTGNLVLKAHWHIIRLTVSGTINFDNEGITISYLPAEYDYGTKVTISATGMEAGYKVVITDGEETYDNTYTFTITTNKALTFDLVPITYTITYLGFDEPGAVNDPTNPKTFTVEEEHHLSVPTSNKEYYAFSGWMVIKENPDDNYELEGSTIPKGTVGDLTIQAMWVPDRYVIYVTNKTELEISGLGQFNRHQYGSTVTLTVNYDSTGGSKVVWTVENIGTYIGSTCSFTMPHEDINLTLEIVELYTRNANTIYFGYYPQSNETDETIVSQLNTKAEGTPTTTDSGNWTISEDSDQQSNYWYIDIDLDEDGRPDYRGVYFKLNSTSSSIKVNGYSQYTAYWFKYELVKWDILKEENGEVMLIADLLLDAKSFYPSDSDEEFLHNGGTGYASNYELSNIRKWLNSAFYDYAFSEYEKELILFTEVDNSLSQTFSVNFEPYVCENTLDKVYLLSYTETENYYDDYDDRKAAGTDYAKVNGIQVDSMNDNNSTWILRSPRGAYNICHIMGSGEPQNPGAVVPGEFKASIYYYGIRPVIWITL